MTTTAVVARQQQQQQQLQQQATVEKVTNVSVATTEQRRVEVIVQRSTPTPPQQQQQQTPPVGELADIKELHHANYSHDADNVETVVDTQPAAVKSEPDCELFDVNLNAMLESEDQSFEDFWQNFDIDSTQENTDEASSTTETASSSPETTDSEGTAADETALLKDLVSAASSATSAAVVASSTAGSAGLSAAKRFDCTRCEKRFASAGTLEKHLLVHAEIRPYRCTVCDIGFKLKVHLKKHNLYRHSEEYPCECSICGKRFKDSSAVRLHERIHSSDRPFQCAHCGKSFKTRENLWGHRNRGPCDKSLMLNAAAAVGASAPSGVVAGTDVTQRFVANNIRLFHSAEFGPILGVPVNATKFVLKEVQCSAARTGVESSTSTPTLSLQAVCSSSGGAVIVTSSAAAGYLPQRLSTIRLGQAQTRTVMSAVSPLTVPTAVVTPIKRDTVDCSSQDVPVSAAAAASMMSASVAKTASVSDRNVLLSRPVAVRPATLFQPDMRKRSKSASASIAAQCPTVQKFLACTGNTITVTNNAISSSCSNNNNNVNVANEKPTESAVADTDSCSSMFNETSITEHSLTDAINVLTGSIVNESARDMMIEGDCLPGVDDLDGTDVDWPIVEDCGILGTPLGRPDKTDYGRYHHQQQQRLQQQQQQDWVDLMSADQLLNSTDDDDLSDDSFADYQLMPSPQIGPTSADGADTSSSGVVSGFDGSSRDVKFDTSDFITPTSDAMWCGWPQENDLNSLLIFGP